MRHFMKKLLLNMGLLFLLSSLISCTMQDPEEEKKLGVEAKETGIVIAVPADKKAKYINIYRKIKNSKVEYNIGEIVPGEKDNSVSYVFTDSFVEPSSSYSYCVRYTYEDYSKKVDWSEPVNNSNGIGELHTAPSSNIALSYNKEKSIIEIKTGSFGFPSELTDTTNWAISMIATNSSKSRVFRITEDAPLTKEIDLRSVLSSDFLTSSFSVESFILEKIEKNTTLDYTVIYWSLPLESELPIENTNDNQIELDTSNWDDNKHDYSQANGSLYTYN